MNEAHSILPAAPQGRYRVITSNLRLGQRGSKKQSNFVKVWAFPLHPGLWPCAHVCVHVCMCACVCLCVRVCMRVYVCVRVGRRETEKSTLGE